MKNELFKCTNDQDSKLWSDAHIAFEHIIEDDSLCRMYQDKTTRHNRDGQLTLEPVLRFLLIYGGDSPSAWFPAFPERDIFLEWMRATANCCCVALERFDLIVGDSVFQPYECTLYTAFLEQCTDSTIECTLASLIYWRMKSTYEETRQECKNWLGLMLVVGGQTMDQYIDRVKTNLPEGPITRSEMFKCIAEAKEISNNVSTMYAIAGLMPFLMIGGDVSLSRNRLNLLMSKCLLREFRNAGDPVLFDPLLQSTTVALTSAPSLLTMSLSLQYLSEACELNGEYRMALKAMVKAYKICFMDKGEHISPSFVEAYPERRNSLVTKMKEMRCAYCERNQSWRKLRPCTGCMHVVYCDRRCQKRHWNTDHRDSCSGTWSEWSSYKTFKSGLRRVFA